MMSAHPVFISPSHPKKRGRFRLEWSMLTTSTSSTPAPETTTPEADTEPPAELAPESPAESPAESLPEAPRGGWPAEPQQPPDPDPEVQGAFVTGWRVLTRSRGDEATTMDDPFSQVRVPLYQQSVTLTAKMWPEDGEKTDAASGGGWSAWRVSGEHLPLVVGGVAGGALIVMLLVAAVVWRLCVLRRDKQYRVRMGDSALEPRAVHSVQPVQPVMPSESAVFASPVSGRWAYQSRLLNSPRGGDCSPRGTSTPPAGLRSPSLGGTPMGTPPPQAWVYGDARDAILVAEPHGEQPLPRAASSLASASPVVSVHRSVSLQLAQSSPQAGSLRRGGYGGFLRVQPPGPAGMGRAPGRPLSAVSSMGSYSAGCSPATPRHAALLPPPPPEFLLPEICEFNPGAAVAAMAPPPPCSGAAISAQYASSSVLDDASSEDDPDSLPEALRTRSLPSSVKNKQRPLASEEDLDQLYAKVNFSKKRKNRMRHDEAAIIAISKSRSQFLDKLAADADADTDALADNEAVIVYNERTAL